MGRMGRTPICVASLKVDAIELPHLTALVLILSFRANILILHKGQKKPWWFSAFLRRHFEPGHRGKSDTGYATPPVSLHLGKAPFPSLAAAKRSFTLGLSNSFHTSIWLEQLARSVMPDPCHLQHFNTASQDSPVEPLSWINAYMHSTNAQQC